jgi:hypothetical protein
VKLEQQDIPPLAAIIAVRRQPQHPMHYVVIYGAVGQKVQMLDYPFPPMWVGYDQLRQVWDGSALLVSADARRLRDLPIGRKYFFGLGLASLGALSIMIAWWRHVRYRIANAANQP